MLANILKRCNLNIDSSPPTSLMAISDDTISTTNWQEMGIFEKVTVLRALCDARLDRPDLEQVTEVSKNTGSINLINMLNFFRLCQQIHSALNLLVRTHAVINTGILVILDCIGIHGTNQLSELIDIYSKMIHLTNCCSISRFPLNQY